MRIESCDEDANEVSAVTSFITFTFTNPSTSNSKTPFLNQANTFTDFGYFSIVGNPEFILFTELKPQNLFNTLKLASSVSSMYVPPPCVIVPENTLLLNLIRLKVLKALGTKDLDVYNEIEDLQYEMITQAQIRAHADVLPKNRETNLLSEFTISKIDDLENIEEPFERLSYVNPEKNLMDRLTMLNECLDKESDFDLLNDNEPIPRISVLELEEGSILHGFENEEIEDFTFEDLIEQSRIEE